MLLPINNDKRSELWKNKLLLVDNEKKSSTNYIKPNNIKAEGAHCNPRRSFVFLLAKIYRGEIAGEMKYRRDVYVFVVSIIHSGVGISNEIAILGVDMYFVA